MHRYVARAGRTVSQRVRRFAAGSFYVIAPGIRPGGTYSALRAVRVRRSGCVVELHRCSRRSTATAPCENNANVVGLDDSVRAWRSGNAHTCRGVRSQAAHSRCGRQFMRSCTGSELRMVSSTCETPMGATLYQLPPNKQLQRTAMDKVPRHPRHRAAAEMQR